MRLMHRQEHQTGHHGHQKAIHDAVWQPHNVMPMGLRAVRVQILVSCSKGISNDTLETVNQIMTRVLPQPLHARLAYLSGPSFAAEARSLCPSNQAMHQAHHHADAVLCPSFGVALWALACR